jgi:hypothetical protein
MDGWSAAIPINFDNNRHGYRVAPPIYWLRACPSQQIELKCSDAENPLPNPPPAGEGANNLYLSVVAG